jgi:hypothetical protein
MIRKMIVSSLVIALFPLAASAQWFSSKGHRGWEISVFGGTSAIKDRVSTTPVTGPSPAPARTVGLKYASGGELGLRIAENRWKNWGAIMEYSFSNQPLRFSNLTDSLPSLALSHSIHHVSYEIAYYPLDRANRFRPFVFAGPGVSLYYIRKDSRDFAATKSLRLTSPWKLTGEWGGGVKILLMDKLAASVQFTDSFTGVPAYGLPPNGSLISGAYKAGFFPSGIMHNRQFNVGLIYQWGGR